MAPARRTAAEHARILERGGKPASMPAATLDAAFEADARGGEVAAAARPGTMRAVLPADHVRRLPARFAVEPAPQAFRAFDLRDAEAANDYISMLCEGFGPGDVERFPLERGRPPGISRRRSRPGDGGPFAAPIGWPSDGTLLADARDACVAWSFDEERAVRRFPRRGPGAALDLTASGDRFDLATGELVE